jgi:cellulose synthase/poly-beta-1,6-N-acetylglucosamine synthase-like glycosyltransferase
MVRRGKGFALDFGLQRLSEHPPDIVIIIDADCRPAPHCINRLAIACKMAGQPIQARYLMHARASAAAPMKIAEFAWLMKNRIRPIGLHRFGFPTHLTGSGMAFPWSVIKNANLASGHIVEDLKLGVDLACAGSPALYCDAASIHSEFPLTAKDSTTQRTRWEHGHLYVILTEAPRMLWIGAKNFDLDLFVLALDLSIPPLVMLIFLIIVEWFVSVAISILSGRAATFEIATLTLAVLTLAIFFAWMRFGRRIVSATELTGGFGYALMKIPVYLKFFIARQVKWVRAKRDGE